MALLKQNLLDTSMTGSLSLGLRAMDVFKKRRPTSGEVGASIEELNREAESIIHLKERIQLSKSPALSILPVLLSDKTVHKTVQEFSGVWMQALAVVLAAKPNVLNKHALSERELKHNRQKNQYLDQHHQSQHQVQVEEEQEQEENEESEKQAAGNLPSSHTLSDVENENDDHSESHFSSVGKHGDLKDSESRRNSVSVYLSTILEGKSDYHDQVRAKHNSNRDQVLRGFVSSQKEKVDLLEKMMHYDDSHLFVSNPICSKRLLLDYALEKFQLFQQLQGGKLSAEAHHKALLALQMEHKKIAFEAVKVFKAKRTADENEEEKIIDSTSKFCNKLLVFEVLK